MTKEAGPATPKSDDYELRHQARSLMYSPDEAYQELMASHRTLERELLAAEERIAEWGRVYADRCAEKAEWEGRALIAEKRAEQAERRAAELEAGAADWKYRAERAISGLRSFDDKLADHIAALSASKGGGVGE